MKIMLVNSVRFLQCHGTFTVCLVSSSEAEIVLKYNYNKICQSENYTLSQGILHRKPTFERVFCTKSQEWGYLFMA